MANHADIISDGGVEPCRVVERSYDDEVERLRRMRLEFATFVDECHTLTGPLWPQNETTGRLKDMLEELKEALDNG